MLNSMKNYLKDIDIFVVSNENYNTLPSDLNHMVYHTNIKILHLKCFDHNIIPLLHTVHTIYITKDFDFYLLIQNLSFSNIKKIIFSDKRLFISNEQKFNSETRYYKNFSTLFPNAQINVFKFNEYDIIEGNNIIIERDVTKVVNLHIQDLDKLIVLNNDKYEARFPNLKSIVEINISMLLYDISVDLIRIACINKIPTLDVKISHDTGIPHDILKYIQLLGIVSDSVYISVNDDALIDFDINFDNQTVIILYGDFSKYTVDYGFINNNDSVIDITYQYNGIYNFIEGSKIHKVKVKFPANTYTRFDTQLPDSVDTMYIEGSGEIKEYLIYTHITEVIFVKSNLFIFDSIWKIIFPNATFRFI